MRTYLECIPCFVRQTLDSVRLLTDDPKIHEQVLREVLLDAGQMDMSQPPPAMAQRIHRLIRKLTGIEDAYREIKRRSNSFALSLYPELKRTVADSQDPFETALRLAIAGNIIDFGVQSVQQEFDESQVHDSIDDAVRAPLDKETVEELRREVAAAQRIFYVADNAGEIVFDRLLIEQMPMEKVTVGVRGRPIINDATMEDAVATGLSDLIEMIDNGSDAPGTILETCSEAFRRRFDESDLIIAKGQGNYETLSGVHKKTFFLLKVKCSVIAKHIGVGVGSMVISRNS